MKSLTKTLYALLLAGICYLPLGAQNLPEVISVRKIELKEDASGVAFHNSFQEADEALQQHGKGIGVSLLVGDRGEREEELLHLWSFELKANRDYYFPTADAEAYPKLGALMQATGINMPIPDPRVESGMDVYTDYVVLGYNQMDNPQGGEVLSLWELEVEPGQEGAFEQLVIQELHPTTQKHIPGMYAYVLKGDRGERAGKYLLVYCFDTFARRNAYFPKPGESSDAFRQEIAKLNAESPDFQSKFQSFIAAGSGEVYTDYVYLR